MDYQKLGFPQLLFCYKDYEKSPKDRVCATRAGIGNILIQHF